MDRSPFEDYRRQFQPPVPAALAADHVTFKIGDPTESCEDQEQVKQFFPVTYGLPVLDMEIAEAPATPPAPIKMGVIFSGGQAPGGHNVLSGLYDKLHKINPENQLIGFIGGPSGLLDNKYVVIDADFIKPYRNMGGFDAICSGRTKIHTEEQFAASTATARLHQLNALAVIGGDDSNTNACLLAERFKADGLDTVVVGVPKTIDRDLMSPVGIDTSFGFDSATKVYASLIGNIETDCLSAKKYWHFVRLMGRSASHITLECALQCRPNICLVGEEVQAKGQSMEQVCQSMVDIIKARHQKGMNYGVALIPEGIIEFIPEFGVLIKELANIIGPAYDNGIIMTPEQVLPKLSEASQKVFAFVPPQFQLQLCTEPDSHGNPQVSKIETEKLLIAIIEQVLEADEELTSTKFFNTQSHFFGYEGRCVPPSNFDATYCYGLGQVAAILGVAQKTGYMACLRNVANHVSEWVPCGLPLTAMMNVEVRKNEAKPVIKKIMTDLSGRPFALFCSKREEWAQTDCYVNPGPIQYYDGEGPLRAVADRPTISLEEEARGRAQ
ncbi:pyrophosphate-dependent phosphofructokinase PfpB [Kipferlia bialata]|uniref:Pyrophosphate--fructose 6-phosphate 1-phosphotransferase n=1 Tax=Kipferlia bialata TaxID=797122 RepID=A0A9K3GGX6_9EUKA|nr:pyrophosphate-dependent phosphofructokinase PfpB [Kipferlia bialata]|eukprot:g4974.t1